MILPLSPGKLLVKRLRIAILLFVLFVVALGELLAGWRSRNWNDPLWIDIWLVNADGSADTQAYLDGIGPEDFASIERFFASQGNRYSVALDTPFRVWVAGQLERPPPAAPDSASWLAVLAWSLRMRWYVTRLNLANDGPTPDITLFAFYRDSSDGGALDRSTALRKGMIAIAHLFARREMHGSNQMVMAHEVLHTLGARDKYDPATGRPLYPDGFAEPDREPAYPQARAELMAGRVPLGPDSVEIPRSLDQVVIGRETAREIGWIEASRKSPTIQ